MTTGAPRDITPLLTNGYQVKIGEYISRGWELLQPKIGIFIGYVAVLFGVNLVLAFIPIVGSIGSFVVSPPLNAGLFIVAYKHLLGEPVEFGDFFKGFDKFSVFFLAALVSGLLTMLGIIVCIVPGIYLGVAYSFVQLLIIDQNLEFWPAMELSRQLITKNFFPMFGFILLLGLINFGGVLVCGLGLLVTLPLTYCAMAIAYMDIMNQGATSGGGTLGEPGSYS
ncbi:hypothetical protein GlitD10_0716 [Gloeomargarita lithophora Alchichica-D10]|uniref:Integral membrane protein n=1 Tax=Gloeomargarita lithophora Alchichica-D10 TaxID=1188229 RepID=A0A1J0AAS0_9CYAN|nr:hypothetical protein [Gloeomargarita lithophora]APB33030.1 hypothetical protein GlitD10_0716 [Gloeomargarita lithophora Alchichica-D10]